MIISGLKIDAFKVELKKLIDAMGDDAFAHNGITLFYSGPDEKIVAEIEKELGTGSFDKFFVNNWVISKAQASLLGARRIDDTLAGQLLTRINPDQYFANSYGFDQKAIDDAIFEAWAFLSREFTKASFGKAYAAVCGASPERVFRQAELPEAIAQKNHQQINETEWDIVDKLYRRSPIKAFRYVSLVDLRWAKRHARREKTTEATAHYYDRLTFYMVQMKLVARARKKKIKSAYKKPVKDHLSRKQEALTKIAL